MDNETNPFEAPLTEEPSDQPFARRLEKETFSLTCSVMVLGLLLVVLALLWMWASGS